MLNSVLVPTGARRLVRVVGLVSLLAALAAAAGPGGAWKKAGADEGLRQAFERAAQYSLAVAPAWMQQQELIASDGAANDSFGISVSVSGDTAVIGACGANGAGAAYVFVQNGGLWRQQQELAASDGATNDCFGASVAVSGDTAVIGASAKNSGRGAAYVFVLSGGLWSQQQELTASDGAAFDEFGVSVSVIGDTALIGAISKNAYQGAAYVFVLGGGVWTQQQELTASDGAAGDCFGGDVAVSDDWAVIGAVEKNNDRGAAYVFVLSGGVWSQQQELTLSDAAAFDEFGASVSAIGDTAVIGAVGKNAYQGAAYVFVLSGGVWTQQQELTASDGAAGDGFGSSVSMSGDLALIGAGGKTVNSQVSQGAAYVFALSGTTWTQQQELTASDGGVFDQFGNSVSVSGNTVVIGAASKTINSQPNQGAAYVFAATQPAITGLSVSGGGANIAQNAYGDIRRYGDRLRNSETL
jgi:hypothetical protein